MAGPRRALAVAALALSAAALPASAADAPPAERFVLLGTGGLTGVYNPVGGAICLLVNRDRRQHGLRCGIEATGGSVANLRGLRSGDLHLGIAQTASLEGAVQGTGEFQPAGPDGELRTVLALHSEAFTVVARKEANVQRFADLKGRKVSSTPEGNGTRAVAQAMLSAAGWKLSDFGLVVDLRPGEEGNGLCDGRVDAFFTIVGHPSEQVRVPAAICGARLVPLDGEIARGIVASQPVLSATTIRGGTYPGNPGDVSTFGVQAMLVTSANVADADVRLVASAIVDHVEEFRSLHPALGTLDARSMASGTRSAPLHPAAARLYREKGWIQ